MLDFVKIVVLGPEGTLSHCVAHALYLDAEINCVPKIGEMFAAVAGGKCELALVPIHNAISGYVEETLKHLLSDKVCVVREIVQQIHFHLVGKGSLAEANTLFTHPLTYKQCQEKVDRLVPHCEIVYTKSNSDAVKQVEACENSALALAIEGHNLELFEEDMQESDENVTRFLALSKEASPVGDRTALMLSNLVDDVKEDELRSIFERNAVKIYELESFLFGEKMIYWVTCSGHFNDVLLQDLFDSLSECCKIKVLGSYV